MTCTYTYRRQCTQHFTQKREYRRHSTFNFNSFIKLSFWREKKNVAWSFPQQSSLQCLHLQCSLNAHITRAFRSFCGSATYAYIQGNATHILKDCVMPFANLCTAYYFTLNEWWMHLFVVIFSFIICISQLSRFELNRLKRNYTEKRKATWSSSDELIVSHVVLYFDERQI